MRYARFLQRITNSTRNILTVKYDEDGDVVYLILFSNGPGNEKLTMPLGDGRKRGHTEGIFYAIMQDEKILVTKEGEDDEELELSNKNIIYISYTNEPCFDNRSEHCKKKIIKKILNEEVTENITIYYNNDYKVSGLEKTGDGFRKETNKFWCSKVISDSALEEESKVYLINAIEAEAKDTTDRNAPLLTATPLKNFLKTNNNIFHIRGKKTVEASAAEFRLIYQDEGYPENKKERDIYKVT